MKRVSAFVMCIMLLLAACLCVACSGKADNGDASALTEEETLPSALPVIVMTSEPVTPVRAEHGFDVLGLIVCDDGKDSTYMTMYGFLHTAENLGYPAKLFRVKNADEALAAVESAYLDGITGLSVYDPNGEYSAAIEAAVSKDMKVAVPYYRCDVEGISSNVIADDGEYFDELSRGIAERMTERSLKSGRILVYGRNTSTCRMAFEKAIADSYPEYRVVAFDRKAVGDELAAEELAQFILYNRDIKGMYVVDADASLIAVKARSMAQSLFRAGIPSPTPTATPAPTPTPASKLDQLSPSATPEYTPNPGLLNVISITMFCCGLSSDNYELFNDNDIYALCIEPYYEASAQATMMLDKALGGVDAAKESRVNRPIVYSDIADKYKAIYDQMRYMFGIENQ